MLEDLERDSLELIVEAEKLVAVLKQHTFAPKSRLEALCRNLDWTTSVYRRMKP